MSREKLIPIILMAIGFQVTKEYFGNIIGGAIAGALAGAIGVLINHFIDRIFQKNKEKQVDEEC